MRARTWQRSTSNALPSAIATMSMLAPMFLSVCTGKYWGAICPSRIPSSIDELLAPPKMRNRLPGTYSGSFCSEM